MLQNAGKVSEGVEREKGMEADVSQDFQDYWNEIRIIQETKRLDEFLDEEYGTHGEGEEWFTQTQSKVTTTPLNLFIY